MNTRLEFQQLMDRFLTNAINAEEHRMLQRMIRDPQNEEMIDQYLEESYQEHADEPEATFEWKEKFSRKLFERINEKDNQAPVSRLSWIKYAAAIILMIGLGTWFYINNQKEKPSVTQKNPVPVQNDVAPGGDRATLTLANGSKIILDSTKSGQLAKEENATITKTTDGKIVYDADVKLGNRILFNTLATPRGGQYQLTLPDGTQVWLNAESSITYPTAFSGKERKVSVTGEAYFEVAKDKKKPFKVEIGTAEIEVLGTHFNVNTYKEEPTKNITLLEGSIRLTTQDSLTTDDSRLTKKNSEHTSLILKPGQQGQLNPATRNLSLAVHPDLEQVMAWKNGRFLFSNSSIESIMNQVSRWYDVDIAYEGKIHGNFVVDISRDVPVSKLLQIMELTNRVHFTIERNKIIVKP